ncbi:uncharacterized protein IL334_004277 [Kwoniella shivajii]|uniref:Uncharacterized protein n=1 Tax=Kwoniella shivajii TaxID=564305 RepID=A0ABZ1D001_9TREE|nr:hypothetical protein IL334_004277 [Kwoniella shivajii]
MDRLNGSGSGSRSNALSSESLSISASLFTSSIDSWIPSNFGVIKPASEKEREFSALLKTDHSDTKLGLGHPSLDAPVRPVQRNGIDGISRRLNLDKKGKAKEVTTTVGTYGDSEDEGESRGKILSKKKNGVIDPFGNGKKKKKDPFSIGKGTIGESSRSTSSTPVVEPSKQVNNPKTYIKTLSATEAVDSVQSNTAHSEEGHSEPSALHPLSTPMASTATPPSPGQGSFPYDGPRLFGSPQKSRSAKRLAEFDDRDDSDEILGGESKVVGQSENGSVETDKNGKVENGVAESPSRLSKTQRRREKRKRAKLSTS